MSVQAQIDRIKANVADSFAAVEEKGGTVPNQRTSDNLAEAIRTIQTSDGTIVMEGLAIATPPDKVDYYYNGLWHEYFDPTGMTFTLRVDLLGMKLALPIRPAYEAIDQHRHRMTYTVRPDAPEGMSSWPEVELILSPDRQVQEGDAEITAEVRWRGQKVSAAQAVNVAYSSPHWYDIEKKPRTWSDFASEFGTWSGVESA